MTYMVSIIIPVYNVEQYLQKCIDSILQQSYSDYEIILIDDGSTDSSGTICDSYQTNKHFKIFHQANRGVSAARNKGLDVAAGDYVLFVDPDDWLADNALGILMREVEDADLLMFNYYVVQKRTDNTISSNKDISRIYSTKHIVKDLFFEILGNSGVLWNKLLKRSAIGDILFLETMSYGEDMVFIAKILKNVHRAKIIPDCLYFYYQNRNGNVVSASIDKRSIEFLKNTRELYKICCQNHCSAVGIKRISVTTNIVMLRIPLTLYGIRNNKNYINECKSLLKVPSYSDYWNYFTDKRFSFREKSKTARFFLGSLYLFLRLLKHKLFSLLWGRTYL